MKKRSSFLCKILRQKCFRAEINNLAHNVMSSNPQLDQTKLMIPNIKLLQKAGTRVADAHPNEWSVCEQEKARLRCCSRLHFCHTAKNAQYYHFPFYNCMPRYVIIFPDPSLP